MSGKTCEAKKRGASKKEQKNAWLRLVEASHALLKKSAVVEIGNALGVDLSDLKTHIEKHDPPYFFANNGVSAEGIAGGTVSFVLVDRLKLNGKAQGFIGRGSQHREYCRVIAEHLGIK